MAISLSKTGNAIKFTFENNAYYLSNGVIEVPLNSLALVTDDSEMFTFKKSATNDVFISGRYSDIGMTKSELESYYKENMVGSTGGSGSGMTSGEVQTMIDESISGKADTSDVQEIASDVSTLSGSVDSNHNAITAVVGDVQTLSGQVQGDETILTGHTANTDIHVTASDKQNWNNKSDFSGSYNDLTDKPTIPVVPTNVSAFNNDAGYATSGYVDSAVSGKMDTSSFNTYSASTDARISEDEEVTAAALNSLNNNKQDKLTAGENITISGNVISAAGGGGGNNVIELTQAQYDALTDVDPDAFYIITDADGGATTGQVQTMINTAIATKQDTLVSGTNIKTINNESLLGSGNIDIQGGGKAIEAGRGISVTTGATADTVSFNLPISAGSGNNSIITGTGTKASGSYSFAEGYYSKASGDYSHSEGYGTANGIGSHSEGQWTNSNGDYSHSEGKSSNSKGNFSHSEGDSTNASGESSHSEGIFTNTSNKGEHSEGWYNVTSKNSNTFGDSGNTLFSVGNGTAENARHNAFEIKQNGDIYITSGGTDIKLQDNLGGGLPESAFTAYTAATDARLAEDEEVTAAALNTLDNKYSTIETTIGDINTILQSI